METFTWIFTTLIIFFKHVYAFFNKPLFIRIHLQFSFSSLNIAYWNAACHMLERNPQMHIYLDWRIPLAHVYKYIFVAVGTTREKIENGKKSPTLVAGMGN